MVLTGKSKYMKENLSYCHFVNTNPTWTDLGSNSVLLGEGDGYLSPEPLHSRINADIR